MTSVIQDLPWSIHHAKAAEVPACESHDDTCHHIHIVIGDDDRHVTSVRIEVAEHEEWDEESSH